MNTQDDLLDDELVDLPAAQGRKPGTFTKGDPRINRSGTRGGDVPQLLRDLRHVYSKPKSKDRTQGRKMLRKLFEEQPEKFVYRLQKAEADYRAAQGQVPPEADPVQEERDEGSEKALAAIEGLLRKRPWEQELPVAGTLEHRLEEALLREAELRAALDELRRA